MRKMNEPEKEEKQKEDGETATMEKMVGKICAFFVLSFLSNDLNRPFLPLLHSYSFLSCSPHPSSFTTASIYTSRGQLSHGQSCLLQQLSDIVPTLTSVPNLAKDPHPTLKAMIVALPKKVSILTGLVKIWTRQSDMAPLAYDEPHAAISLL